MSTIRIAQGEVNVRYVESVPADCKPLAPVDGRYIIGHSESGHHHVISAEGTTVMERNDPPAGMRILYAIIDDVNTLRHEAPGAHDVHDLAPGIVEFRISREYNPFTETARQVAD
jgi:hypothetical protein